MKRECRAGSRRPHHRSMVGAFGLCSPGDRPWCGDTACHGGDRRTAGPGRLAAEMLHRDGSGSNRGQCRRKPRRSDREDNKPPPFRITPRKGSVRRLDKPASKLVNAIILPVPIERTKGVVLFCKRRRPSHLYAIAAAMPHERFAPLFVHSFLGLDVAIRFPAGVNAWSSRQKRSGPR